MPLVYCFLLCFLIANRKVCEDYEGTTTVESTDEEEDTIEKRSRKKKSFPDFVSGNLNTIL